MSSVVVRPCGCLPESREDANLWQWAISGTPDGRLAPPLGSRLRGSDGLGGSRRHWAPGSRQRRVGWLAPPLGSRLRGSDGLGGSRRHWASAFAAATGWAARAATGHPPRGGDGLGCARHSWVWKVSGFHGLGCACLLGEELELGAAMEFVIPAQAGIHARAPDREASRLSGCGGAPLRSHMSGTCSDNVGGTDNFNVRH
jgi:hypothetical protein